MKQFTLSVSLMLLILFAITSCNDDNDPSYTGDNNVVVMFDSATPTAEEFTMGVEKQVTLKVQLTRTLNEAVTVTPTFSDQTEFNNYFEVSPANATIAAGSRDASFTIKSEYALASAKKEFTVNVTVTPEKDLKLGEGVKINLVPAPGLPELTEEQLTLLNGYKQNLGIDVAAMLGTWVCNGTVKEPGESEYPNFTQPQTHNIANEVMVVTLSSQATADKPVLKFVENALGLKGYMGKVYERLTILDKEYWNNEDVPHSNPMMDLIGWTESSKETYTLDMDFIEPQKGTNNVNFVTNINTIVESIDPYLKEMNYDDENDNAIGSYSGENVIPFIFHFSPWDRIFAEYKKDFDSDLKIKITQGNVNPYQIMFQSAVDEDGWEGEDVVTNFVKPQLTIDPAKGELVFKCAWDNLASGAYNVIDIKATKKTDNN